MRDSFTMPSEDFALIAALKNRALMFKRPAKKSELLCAGLYALQALSAPALRSALDALYPAEGWSPKARSELTSRRLPTMSVRAEVGLMPHKAKLACSAGEPALTLAARGVTDTSHTAPSLPAHPLRGGSRWKQPGGIR